MTSYSYFYFWNFDIEFYFQHEACYVQNMRTNSKTKVANSVPDTKSDQGLTRKVAVLDGKCYAVIGSKLFNLLPDSAVELAHVHTMQRG